MEDNSQWTPIVVEQQEELKAQLAQCQERLAMAEGLLKECNSILKIMAAINHRPSSGDPLRDGIEAFLSHAPGEYVVVRREDLKDAMYVLDDEVREQRFPYKQYNRLKAALEGK